MKSFALRFPAIALIGLGLFMGCVSQKQPDSTSPRRNPAVLATPARYAKGLVQDISQDSLLLQSSPARQNQTPIALGGTTAFFRASPSRISAIDVGAWVLIEVQNSDSQVPLASSVKVYRNPPLRGRPGSFSHAKRPLDVDADSGSLETQDLRSPKPMQAPSAEAGYEYLGQVVGTTNGTIVISIDPKGGDRRLKFQTNASTLVWNMAAGSAEDLKLGTPVSVYILDSPDGGRYGLEVDAF